MEAARDVDPAHDDALRPAADFLPMGVGLTGLGVAAWAAVDSGPAPGVPQLGHLPVPPPPSWCGSWDSSPTRSAAPASTITETKPSPWSRATLRRGTDCEFHHKPSAGSKVRAWLR
jgi:hypothetical protein